MSGGKIQGELSELIYLLISDEPSFAYLKLW